MNLRHLLCLVSLFLFSCSSKKQVDLIIHKARIYSVNEKFDVANTMVVHQGRLLAIGGDSLLQQYSSINTMDMKGAFIYPGFIDAHCHFTGYAMDSYKLKLFGTKSFNEIVKKVVAFAHSNDRTWLEGTGWDQNDWVDKRFPMKDTLDQLFPDKPVFLLRVDGHAVLLNQKALDLCGIKETTTISGGELIRKDGKLTGILTDNAINLVRPFLPVLTAKEAMHTIVSAQREFLELGLTSIVECGVKKEVIDWMKQIYQNKQLQLRSTFMLNADSNCMNAYLTKAPLQTDDLHVAGFKVYADGSLGSRGACLLKEYSDRPQHMGAMLTSTMQLKHIITDVIQSPYQLCVHAIGDSANRNVLALYANALKSSNDRRWRIEHAQVVHTSDMHLFGDYGIIPSVQPTHATSDMYWAEDRLGEDRMNEAYAYKKLLTQNKWMPLGTDFPVEHLNPIYTFYAAVFRKDKTNFPEAGFQMENALTREEALRGMTIWAAKSVFEEKEKGSLEPGKLADFVILDTDLMHAEASRIYNAKVLATYINGIKVFGKK